MMNKRMNEKYNEEKVFTRRTVINALIVSGVLMLLFYLLGGAFPKYLLLIERSGLFVAMMKYAVLFGIAGIFLAMNNMPHPPVAGQMMPAFVFRRPYRVVDYTSEPAVC